MTLERHFYRRILAIAFPTSLSMLLRVLAMFVATVLVARLGSLPLAGLGLGYVFGLTLSLFGMGCMLSVTIIAGKHLGAQDHILASQVLGQSVVQSICISIPMVVLLLFSGSIFMALGQNPRVVVLAQQYCRGFAWGVPAYLMSLVLQQFLMALGRAKVVISLTVITLLLNIIGFYLGLTSPWGLPVWGVYGVGLTLSLVNITMCLVTVVYFYRQKSLKIYHFHTYVLPIKRSLLWEFFNLGYPIAISMTLEVAIMLVLSLMLGVIDHYALASYQIVSQLAFFPLMIPMGLSQAATILTTLSCGSGNVAEIRHGLRITVLWSVAVMLVFSALFLLVPQVLIHGMLRGSVRHAAVVIHYAIPMLMVVGVYQLFESVRLILVGMLRGLKDVKVPMLISVISSWGVGISIAYLLGFTLGYGVLGVWCSLIPALLVSLILVGWRLRQQLHKHHLLSHE